MRRRRRFGGTPASGNDVTREHAQVRGLTVSSKELTSLISRVTSVVEQDAELCRWLESADERSTRVGGKSEKEKHSKKQRQRWQHESILSHIVDRGLCGARTGHCRTCFVEMGAGKGELSEFFHREFTRNVVEDLKDVAGAKDVGALG